MGQKTQGAGRLIASAAVIGVAALGAPSLAGASMPPPGMSLWVNADSLPGTNGSAVPMWPDLSGNRNPLTVGAQGTNPTLAIGAWNGHSAVDFNGAPPELQSSKDMQGGSAPYDVFIVAAPTSGSGYFGWGTPGNQGHEVVLRTMNGDGTGLDTYWWGLDDYQPAAPTSRFSPNVVESFWNNGSDTRGMTLNGQSISSFSIYPGYKQTTPTPFRLGSSSINALGTVEPFSGKIAEAIVYESNLSQCAREDVINYLEQKYGLPASAGCSPTVATAPAISGYAYQGKTLTVSTGSWNRSPTSYAYQWQRCANGTCTAIPGATNSSYVVQAADLGDTLDVVVSAANANGTGTATTAPTATVSKFVDVVLGDGPLAYWRLGDAFDQTNLSDQMGGHPGTYMNGAAGTAGRPAPQVSYGVAGDGDTAAIFTGNGTYGSVAGIQAPQSAYTIEAYFKPTNLGAQMIFSQGGAGAVWINGSGQLAFRQVDNFGDSEIDSALPAGFDLSTFHQVVATWDGTVATLYLDGVAVGHKTVADPVSGSATVYLGYGALAPWFSGYLDEVAYYGHALTPGQVLTHYNADPPFNQPKAAGEAEFGASSTASATHHVTKRHAVKRHAAGHRHRRAAAKRHHRR